MKNFIKGSLKAWVAGSIAGLTFAVPVVDDGIVLSEGLGIALAFIVAWNGVYWIENKGPSAPNPR